MWISRWNIHPDFCDNVWDKGGGGIVYSRKIHIRNTHFWKIHFQKTHVKIHFQIKTLKKKTLSASTFCGQQQTNQSNKVENITVQKPLIQVILHDCFVLSEAD